MNLGVTFLLLFNCCSGLLSLPSLRSVDQTQESRARSYLDFLDELLSEKCYETVAADWAYETNINSENEKFKLETSLSRAKLIKEVAKNITNSFRIWRDFEDPQLRRKLKKLSVLGAEILPEDDYKKYKKLETDMIKHYSTTKVCSYKSTSRSCDLSLEPDLTKVMKESRNEEELRHAWVEWHNKSGGPIRESYQQFVELSNRAATMNNFKDTGDYWLDEYESASFKHDVEQLWQTLKPLYQELHAYVRAKLRDVYGGQILDDGLIPAHLLGNMWAQSWENVYSLTVPYPNKASVDVTQQMEKQGYTPLKMFQVSDEFFTSLGLIPMPAEFWEESMLEKPNDREVVCHASAWDFCNGKDFRIKQCTRISTKDLVVVHHEMGHIQYFLQYKNQPFLYRTGANPGFHEAVGDTLALSVNTPKHLKQIGLLDDSTAIDDYETSINFLFAMAVEKIAFLPFSYLIDKYRWDIYDGTVEPSQYNAHWWKLRKEYQGIKAPVERSEENFDAGAKFHVPANVEYLRYFVSAVIQFQFHKSLCQEAGQYEPGDPNKLLHNCDIYQSKAAGSRLAAGLSIGASQPWPEVMKVMTGNEKMDASAIREYFKPLEEWLKKKNSAIGEETGWF